MNFKTFFHNYETTKFTVLNPEFENLVIIAFFLILTIAAFKKKTDIQFCGVIETTQAKGMAILLIILGHLWVHASIEKPLMVFGGDCVALFFILSGFGLVRSCDGKRIKNIKLFFLRRIKKVMIPYWVGTILLLILDLLFLNQTYTAGELFSTFIGINFTQNLRHIDYVRWFITFLIFWYFLFSILFYKVEAKKAVSVMFIVAFILLPFNYYVLKSWYQFFSFPLGCLFGVYFNQIKQQFIAWEKLILLGAVICFIFVLLFKSVSLYLIATLPYIIVHCINEVSGIIFSLCLIVLLAYWGSRHYYSIFLEFIGKISYELFLLHGAFLVKYNFIDFGSENAVLISQFSIFLLFITVLSKIFSDSINLKFLKFSFLKR